jgi:hypothetical protein
MVEEAVGTQDRVLDQVLGVARVLGEPQASGVEGVEVPECQLLELAAGAVALSLEHVPSGSLTRVGRDD